MKLPPFELHRPESLAQLHQLCASIADDGGSYDFLGGGTDVLPNYKNRLNPREHVISLSRIDELQKIAIDEIGAGAHISELAADGQIAEHFPGLSEAARQIASPPLRNLGTVGGNLLLDTRCYYFNQSEFWRQSKGYCMKADGDSCLVVPQKEICYATYSGDLAPVFLVLDASIELACGGASREIPLRDFYAMDGIRRFDKKPGELLTRVRIPKASIGLASAYRKLRVRDTIEYPVMGVAMGLRSSGGTIDELHVAVTGSEATPLYYGDLGFTGRKANEDTARELGEALVKKVKTYRNVPLPPGYRKAMAGEYASQLLLELA